MLFPFSNAYLHSVREPKGDNLRHWQLAPAVKHNVEVNMHHLCRALIQQDVVQVPVPQA